MTEFQINEAVCKACRLLLIEDNKVVRKLVSTIIEKHGGFVIVGQLESASRVIEEISETQPEIVIIDIGLPGINGIEATALIKEKFPQIYVLILTARTADSIFFDSFSAGADGYMLKDRFSEDKLMAALDTVKSGKVWLDPLIARQVLDYNTDAETLRAARSKPVAVQTLSTSERQMLEQLIEEDSKKTTVDLDRGFLKNLSRFASDEEESKN